MKNSKKKQILIFIAIVFFIVGEILPRELNNLDEIWNFNFANSIAKGMLPYKDFNIIQGPLVPLIIGLILKILGQEMIVTRFLTVILNSIVLFLVYKIMCKLEIKDYLKYLVIIILAIIMKPYFALDYNWSNLCLVLLIIYLEINKENTIKKQVLLGIIAGFTITIKQTTGLIISITTIGWCILEIKNLNELKIIFKNIFYRFLGVISVVILFLLTLVALGILSDYIDYCILGIKTFSNSISYVDRLIKNQNIIIRVLSIYPIIVYIALLLIYIIKKQKKAMILLIYSIAQMIVVYPIADEAHFVLAIVPTVISIAYLINYLSNKITIKENEEIFLSSFLIAIIFLSSIYYFIVGIKEYSKQNINTELPHFKYIPINQKGIEENRKIGNYINENEKKVYILDATASLYMIPINKYNKDFDMFNKGNFGAKGEDGQIEKIKNLKNPIFLIRNKKYNRNWQNPEKVREYIINNYNKKGEIGIFDIYE